MRIPKAIQNLTENFEKLPGIGPKTAQRLTFYLLHNPQDTLEKFAEALVNLKKQTSVCSICKNIGSSDPCEVCSDENRNKGIVAIVETPMDLVALERAGFDGLYHVLHGAINPLNNIGPEDIFVKELIERLGRNTNITEVILATNTGMEGEATAMYIKRLIVTTGIKITRIARGMPVGGDIEYADNTTLKRSIEGRGEY